MPKPAMNRPWFPPVFAVYLALHIAATNPGQAGHASVLIASIVAVGVPLIGMLLLRPRYRHGTGPVSSQLGS
jgi:hypothetical protein